MFHPANLTEAEQACWGRRAHRMGIAALVSMLSLLLLVAIPAGNATLPPWLEGTLLVVCVVSGLVAAFNCRCPRCGWFMDNMKLFRWGFETDVSCLKCRHTLKWL